MSNNQTWDDIKAGLRAIIRSRAFWAALVSLAQAIVFRIWPNFPTDIWESLNLLLAAVLMALGVVPAAIRAGQVNRAKARMAQEAASLAAASQPAE